MNKDDLSQLITSEAYLNTPHHTSANNNHVNGIHTTYVGEESPWNVNPNSFIYTSSMTNGAVLSVSTQQMNNAVNDNSVLYERNLLHQIIAKDVQHPNNKKKSLDSKDTVVKQSPNGAIQIMYRKMVNPASVKNSQLAYILPKPVLTDVQCTTFSRTEVHSCSTPASMLSSLPCSQSPTDTITCSVGSDRTLIHKPQEENSPKITSCVLLSVNSNSAFSRNLTINLPKMQNETTSVDTANCIKPASLCSTVFPNSPCADYSEPVDENAVIPVDDALLSTYAGFEKLDNFDLELDCLNPETFDVLNFKNLFNDNTALNQDTLITTSSVSMNLTLQPTYMLSSVADNTKQSTDSYLCEETVLENYSSMPNDFQANNTLLPLTSECMNIETQHEKGGEQDGMINIIDVSPEISTISGGNKIILIGSWNAKDARYSCKFGDVIVNAELIQSGVLRCFSPPHKSGKLKLLVLCNGKIVSNSVVFEFVDPISDFDDNGINHDSWLSVKDESLVELLKQRIFAMVEIFGLENVKCNETSKCDIEEELVSICKPLTGLKVEFQFDYDVDNTMTILHLAAALGYIKLIQLFLSWVESNPNRLISVEACPTRTDQFKLLPIMWSAAKGHFNTTCVLHQWDENAINAFDACGCTAIDLAKECGHDSLVSYLERLLKKSNSSRESSIGCDISSASPYSSQVTPATQTWTSSETGESSMLRTLGKTLAHIQSIISDQDDEIHDMRSDGEESLFETSPFTPRQRSFTEENRPSASATQHASSSPAQANFSMPARETAEFCEFFFKEKTIEKDFEELTLTDAEQEDLYRAANVIQSAFKSYKGRRKQRDSEFSAAVLIQSYYRRYKQYAAFKKMQKGAVVIQNQYRAHREKAKKKCQAASVIQNYYRRYRERKHSYECHDSYQEKNRILQQAERKTKRFLKQSSNRFGHDTSDHFLLSTEYEKMDCENNQ